MSYQQVEDDRIRRKQSIDSQTKNKSPTKNVTFTGVSASKYEMNQSNRYCTQDSLSDGQIVQIQGQQQQNIEEEVYRTPNTKIISHTTYHSQTVIPRINLQHLKHKITEQQDSNSNVENKEQEILENQKYEKIMTQVSKKEQEIQVLKQANQRLSHIIKENNRNIWKKTQPQAKATSGSRNNKMKQYQEQIDKEESSDSEQEEQQQILRQAKNQKQKEKQKESKKRQRKSANRPQTQWYQRIDYKQVYMGITCGIIFYLLARIIGVLK